MRGTYLVLDIETIPDPTLLWDAAKDGFPPPLFHRVVTLGVLWLDADLTLKRLGVFGAAKTTGDAERDEQNVLEDFARFIDRERPHLVTFNGRGFDLPVLANRCLRHGVAFGAYYAERDYRYRFSDVGHIDLADVLSDHGASRMPRLDSMAKLIGLPGKLDTDGSMVEQMHGDGRIEEIRAYCLQDVVQTAFLFLRAQLLRGHVDRATYHTRARALWEALEPDARVAPVLTAADRERVLLSAPPAAELES